MHREGVLIARQPIYDADVHLVAYEILYRSIDPERATFRDGDEATARVAVHAILDIGLDALVGRVPAFINTTRNVLVQRLYEFLPSDRVVLEVLENVMPDREVIEALARAHAAGYQIAVDDWVGDERLAPLLEFADIVKVDLPSLSDEQTRDMAKRLARKGRRLLAEKVETHAEFAHCRDAGFDLFQGYFFAKPQLVRRASLPADRASMVQLLARIQDVDADIEEIEQLVVTNVALSYKLLRYVNSAIQGLQRRIESIRHAVLMLGIERVRMCVTLLMLGGLDDKPHELVVTALVRARYCQVLAVLSHRERPHQYFTVGLLSLLDAFMDRPMDELLAELSIAPELEAALLRREGPLGEILEVAIACERADWSKLIVSGLDADALRTAYVQTLSWVAENEAELASAK